MRKRSIFLTFAAGVPSSPFFSSAVSEKCFHTNSLQSPSSSLVRVSAERAADIQSALAYFGQQISYGATLNGRIIKIPIEEQTPGAVHGIQLELLLPDPSGQTSSVIKMLRIAHCDANCRNWEWDEW